MDWDLAIEKNREALKRILAMLVGMVAGGRARGQFTFFPPTSALPQNPAPAEKSKLSPALTLPRHLHRFVLRLLRPAEAATRRLIIIAARGLVVELSLPRIVKPRPQSIFVRDGVGTGIVRKGSIPDRALVALRPAPRVLSLPLFDPLRRWGGRRRPKQASMPRISFFDRPRDPDPLPLSPDDPLDAGRLHRRLEAMASALDDLPRAAKRLARWQAHRDAVIAREREAGHAGQAHLPPGVGVSGRRDGSSTAAPSKPRHRRLSPMRPGHPPGWRRQPTHQVYEVLNELHGLAIWARERPDTS